MKQNLYMLLAAIFIFVMPTKTQSQTKSSTLTKEGIIVPSSRPSRYGELSTLHQAAREGRVDLIANHLKANLMLVNDKNSLDNTPLHEAVVAGQKNACEFF